MCNFLGYNLILELLLTLLATRSHAKLCPTNAQYSISPNVQEDDHFHVEDNCKDELLNDVTKIIENNFDSILEVFTPSTWVFLKFIFTD